MIAVYPLILIAVGFVLWRNYGKAPPSAGEGWAWFGAWAVAGAVMTFSFLTGFSIGLLILPVAAALVVWVVRSAPRPREAIGFLAGVGAVLLLAAFSNRDYTPCPTSGQRAHLSPGSSFSCGGFDPIPWLVAGSVIVSVVVIGFALLRWKQKDRP
ncbi:MAG TPA: hypothetical protein VF986_05025 [Actinomycetota bacterium]